MSFSGTQDKCKACDKTVHFIDLLSADGVPYHKTCFKCSHCKGTLSMCSYSSMEGVLYCKPHFEQLFKETGSFTKKFPTGSKSGERDLTRAPSKVSSIFCGTQDKCASCKKTVYPLEKLTVEGEPYHKTCFRCAHGGCILTTSNYAALHGTLYCKIHFQQLFKEKGSYNHVINATKKNTNQEETTEEEATQEAPAQEEPAKEEAAQEEA
ncbi:GATA type zinc finger transcription factor family protein [Rhynchospora pubera]|uniref:GATA type zinc finger transcription factor family protein n=1 Tax=Rhynchospora pubera TaxID=906938 RepID=A0AAV8HAY5_9POAL|nr:GATA type zinc finger transcription factor family protein [Rhynchospora pubera]KAJ4812013.1 GATA type zinc finger transcription factor family protein [Rhynchospora pubera]